MNYQFKMQWVFNNNAEDKKNCFAVIKAIGAGSLTAIYFRDYTLKIVGEYSGMVQYHDIESTKKTIQNIKKSLLENDSIRFIELLRK